MQGGEVWQTKEEKLRRLEAGEPLEFSHTLETQIGGQIDAGFVIAGFYEDRYAKEGNDLLSRYMAVVIATRAILMNSFRDAYWNNRVPITSSG